MRQHRAGLVALAAVGALVVTSVALRVEDDAAAGRGHVLDGRVVDERGTSVVGAVVDLGDGVVARSDRDGRYRGAVGGGSRLITARAEGHLSRTQAAQPGTPSELTLTGEADTTLALRFGGDVMFGRRYYDRNADGDRRDALLPPGASVEKHAALLTQVRPLLQDADLTVVNLETPLVADPYLDPTAPRPPAFHPTKEFVFASAPESVQALLDSGVGAVSLGNNHVYDALGPGLDSTLEALNRAGMPHFGAGRTADEAWAPALIELKGQRLAFLACTTITGTEHSITYVADQTRGGAAQCTTERVRRAVEAARGQADAVVLMIHGGEEYEADQTDLVRRLTTTAEQSGAALIVNGHPHVVGGITVSGGAVVAETTGNLLFDQTVWPTFLSYLLRVDLRAGRPVLATVDPLLLEDGVPRPTVGLLADAAARRAAGLLPGPTTLRGPGAFLAVGRPPTGERRPLPVTSGRVARLPPGQWVEVLPSDGEISLGSDLLWTGSFEDLDTDPGTPGAHGWAFGRNVRRTADAACGAGVGMQLRRSPVSTDDVVLTPAHRQLVEPGSRLSVVVDVRRASAGASLELAQFSDTKGPSTSTLIVPVPTGDRAADECRQVRLDTVVPPGVVAVQPFLRLLPTASNSLAAHLSVDDVRLIVWAPPGSTGRQYDSVEARDDVTLTVTDDAALP